MKDNVANIIKKPDQKRLVISKFRIQCGDVFRLCRDAEDDRTRITRRQRQDGKHKKCHPEQHRNHI